MAFGSFSSLFLVLCSSSDVALSLLVSLLAYILLLLVVHCLAYIDKQLSRKATLIYVSKLVIVRNFPTIPNPLSFSFSFKSTQKFSRQNFLVRLKNAYCPFSLWGRANARNVRLYSTIRIGSTPTFLYFDL